MVGAGVGLNLFELTEKWLRDADTEDVPAIRVPCQHTNFQIDKINIYGGLIFKEICEITKYHYIEFY